jgi:hypothetical protein
MLASGRHFSTSPCTFNPASAPLRRLPTGNIKATTPIAFTTTLLVWALMSFGSGFTAAGQAGAALDSIRWGSDYLLKVHKMLPDTNQSMLVTRVSGVGVGPGQSRQAGGNG